MTAGEARLRGCALVTGGGRGIGAAAARALAADGWAVGIGYRARADAASKLACDIVSAGGRAEAIGGDVAEPETLDATFAELGERFGPVLVLVNTAAVPGAAFQATRLAVGPMLRSNFGRIISLGRAAPTGFSRAVAEGARHGVTVNAVAPGAPERVAACVRFLASEQAAYVTGHVLTP